MIYMYILHKNCFEKKIFFCQMNNVYLFTAWQIWPDQTEQNTMSVQ